MQIDESLAGRTYQRRLDLVVVDAKDRIGAERGHQQLDPARALGGHDVVWNERELAIGRLIVGILLLEHLGEYRTLLGDLVFGQLAIDLATARHLFGA